MTVNEIARDPMIHDLKIWPEYFEAVARGDKTFEVRKWDRPYRVGDTLWLREWDNVKLDYTDRSVYRKVTYILDLTYLPGDNVPHFAGYCVIGMQGDTAEIERLKEKNKALESDNYNADMNLTHLKEQLAESQRREKAAVEDLYKACKHSPCNTGVCIKKNCTGNHIPCEFEWRGPQDAVEGE